MQPPKKGPYLFIADTLPKVRGATIFDPTKDRLNLLRKLDYRKICDIVDVFDALFPRGDSTLTKDTGLDAIAEALDADPTSLEGLIPKPNKHSTTGEVWAYGKVRRLMRSPVLSQMLSSPRSGFHFKGRVLARVNRAEVGEFDAKAITYFLMAQYPGTIVIPKYGSYFHPSHLPLIRDGRLIVGGVLFDDAIQMAKQKSYIVGTVEFNDHVFALMH